MRSGDGVGVRVYFGVGNGGVGLRGGSYGREVEGRVPCGPPHSSLGAKFFGCVFLFLVFGGPTMTAMSSAARKKLIYHFLSGALL